MLDEFEAKCMAEKGHEWKSLIRSRNETYSSHMQSSHHDDKDASSNTDENTAAETRQIELTGVMSDEQLFKEIVEEEKLDEQAAKKEEIQAAEDEEAGIMP